jgi:hypothetical protein
MLHSIRYDPQGIIFIKVRGPLTLAEVRQVMAEAGRLAHDHQCFRLLSDTLEMELKLSMAEVYYLPGMFAELLSTLGLQVHQFRTAVLVSPNDQILPFFETVSRNRGHNVKLFQDQESARRWLLDTQVEQ